MHSAIKIGSKNKPRENVCVNILWSDIFNSLMAEGFGLTSVFPPSIFLYDQCGWKQEWLK
jgi:hypothetical protein